MTHDNSALGVAVENDLADIDTLAHLFKYDSIHGRLKVSFKVEGNKIVFENGKVILFGYATFLAV